MTTSPLRVGIVGLDHWYWAFSFAQAIVSSSRAELVALADRDVERAQETAQRFGVVRVTADPRELIEDPQIDVIASFVSIDQNPSICIAAADHGKQLFSVKPMARTLAEATQILDAVRRAGVIFMPVDGTLNANAAKSPKVELFGRAGTLNIADYPRFGQEHRRSSCTMSTPFLASAAGSPWILNTCCKQKSAMYAFSAPSLSIT